MAPQTTLRNLRTLRETKKREATCRALRTTSRLLGWPLRPRITRLRAFFEDLPPPTALGETPPQRTLERAPAMPLWRDVIISLILYPIPRIMSMATRKSKPTGVFLDTISFLGDAASSRVTCRRGETPHLLELSLIAICDRASNSKQHNKLRRFTKRLRYRCGMSFALLNRPHPTRRGGLSHGDAASSRVKFAALPKGVRRPGPCGCFAVRATRSPNPTPSARAHPATDKVK